MGGVVTPFPISVDLEHDVAVERWRPLLNWLLAIPHFVVLYVLGVVINVVVLVAFFPVLLLGRHPRGLFDFQVMYWRYSWRTMSFALGLRGGYPPFDLQTKGQEPDVAVFAAEHPAQLSRWAVLNWLLALPHYVVLFLLAVAASFVWPIGAIAVLVTGRWPASIHHLLVGLGRWAMRVYGYAYLLTDRYPPFSLD